MSQSDFEEASAETPKRRPLRVQCNACGHRFTALFTPMPPEKIRVILDSLHCPSCAADRSKIAAPSPSAQFNMPIGNPSD